MQTMVWLLSGGFAKGYRTQILGLTTALSAIALWTVGDLSTVELIEKLPLILGGLGLATLGAKVNAADTQGGDLGPGEGSIEPFMPGS